VPDPQLNAPALDAPTASAIERYVRDSIDAAKVGGRLNVKDYGATGDGVTDDTAAIQSAITAATALNGAEIYFPPGDYKCASSLNLDSLRNITFVGATGNGAPYSPPPSSQLIYTGTGARFISARSAIGCTFRALSLRYSNALFTGKLIDFDHATATDACYNLIEHCLLSGYATTAIGATLVSLNNAIICAIVDCNFQYATVGINGCQVSYSNSHAIERCTFGNLNTSAIMNAGEKWTVQNCTFELGPRAYYDNQVGGLTRNLTWRDNWHGDGTLVGADTWFSYGTTSMLGLVIEGNTFNTQWTNTPGIKLTQGAAGVQITGNQFIGASNAGIDFGGVGHVGVFVAGNTWTANPINVSGNNDNFIVVGNFIESGTTDSYFRMSSMQDFHVGSHNLGGVAQGIYQFNAPATTDCLLELNGDAGRYKTTRLRTAGAMRWLVGANNAAEAGANAGSNYVIGRYDDGGAFLGWPIIITRSTGAVAFEAAIAAGGAVTGSNLSGTNTGDQYTSTTASRLIGRGSASAGAAQEITLGTGLSMSGTTLNASGGAGTVTSVSVTTAAGVSGSVANPTTTPAITIALGAITPTSVAASGTVTGSNLSGTNTGDDTSATILTKLASSNIATSGSILSSGATAGIGYSTGAGGTITQNTSKATGVTLNKACGEIVMNAAALAASTTVSFVLTNSAIAAGDNLLVNHVLTGTIGLYLLNAVCAAGSATIYVRNTSAGSLSEAIKLRFTVIKGVTA
jgi:hypothetical protein